MTETRSIVAEDNANVNDRNLIALIWLSVSAVAADETATMCHSRIGCTFTVCK